MISVAPISSSGNRSCNNYTEFTAMETPKPHAILLASPGMGHIIPVAELAKCMVANHGFKVTLFMVTTDSFLSQTELITSLHITQKDLDIVVLPLVDISALIDSSTGILTQLRVMMRQAFPDLRRAILELEARPVALVVDLFGTESFEMADEFRLLKYMFVTSNAKFLALTIHVPTLDGDVLEEEHIKKREPLAIPGCKEIRFEDTLVPLLNRNDQMYDEYMQMGMEMRKADGVLVNTWEDLEPKTLSALRDASKFGMDGVVQPVHPVGPLIRTAESHPTRNAALDWLDAQPKRSVLYVSFGSGGTLSSKQTVELAWGLEMSKQRFIWVVRPPNDLDSAAALFNPSKSEQTTDFFPDGFVARTQGTGLVIPLWAPQTEILSHESIGGFLTHCGWNSTLESIVNGVPMVAWPLYAEQRMNAAMLIEEIGVAVGLKTIPTQEVVSRTEIEHVVRELMEVKGEEKRARVGELKLSVEKALREGGSSYKALSHIAQNCLKHGSISLKK